MSAWATHGFSEPAWRGRKAGLRPVCGLDTSHNKIYYSQWIRGDIYGNLVKHCVNSFVLHIQLATKIIGIASKNNVEVKQSP
jgi:hypothetical protein